MLDADTIVIGSGAGGLTAGLTLAQAGEKVLVLERHDLPGGWCQSFRREGHRFSPGVHYIGQLGQGNPTALAFEGLGVADDLAFVEMNPDGYEHIWIKGKTFDVPRGLENVVERYKERFPRETTGIEDYFFLVNAISEQIGEIQETKSFKDFLTVPYRTRHLGRYGIYSLERILRDRIEEPLLRDLLAIPAGTHGLPPSKVPFAMHAAVVGHYLNGAYYPQGGAAAIPRAFMRALRRNGGQIELSTTVDKILVEKRSSERRAIGVRLADGRELRADRVVSNATPHVTYEQLVGREHLSRGLRRKLDRTRYSFGSLLLFLATDLDLKAMGMDSGNYWYVRTTDYRTFFDLIRTPAYFEEEELGGLFFGITTLKDPGSMRDGLHAIEVVSFVGHEPFMQWAHTASGNRPEAYEELKRRLTDTILRSVERLIPGIREHLVYCDLATPLTNMHYVNATEGCCYGTEKSLRQIGPFSFKPISEIQGLALCGASVYGHGVSGAMFSGMGMAAELLGCRPSELLRDTGQKLRTYPAEQPDQWPRSIHDKRNMRRAAAAAPGS